MREEEDEESEETELARTGFNNSTWAFSSR